MVQHPPAGRHPARGNDNGGVAQIVQGLRLLHGPVKMNARWRKGLNPAPLERVHFQVVVLVVTAVQVRAVDGHGTVDVDGQRMQPLLLDQFTENVQ